MRDMLYGAQHFNELERGLPGISRALLADRLRRLEQEGLIERRLAPTGRTTGYRLTEAGSALQNVVDALVEWGATWCFSPPRAEELDPVLLLWWMRDGIYKDRLPPQKVIVEFVFREARKQSYWMVFARDDISLCLTHPGFDVDVLVNADLSTLFEVWLGRVTLADAIRAGQIELEAVPALKRAFPRWLALSPLAGAVRRAQQAAAK
jgi:DNA-binding HxlR family transcriptional regulator